VDTSCSLVGTGNLTFDRWHLWTSHIEEDTLERVQAVRLLELATWNDWLVTSLKFSKRPLSMKDQGWKNIVVVQGRGGESEEERIWEMVKVGKVFTGGENAYVVSNHYGESKMCKKTIF